MRKVVEIAPLVPLQQRPQLGRQHFLPRERRNGRPATEPRIRDLKRQRRRRVESLDLTGVDLDLQPDRHATAILGLDSEAELGRDRAVVELCPTQPRLQNDTQLVEEWTDRTV